MAVVNWQPSKKSIVSKKENFASPWKKVAQNWGKYYAPPGRPSPEDCKIYKQYIKRALNGKPGRALVLGMTPEIRNVLHTLPVEVTCIDINLEMIFAMNQFVSKSEKDILVRGSWVENPLADNYYDIILGDLTWANVPKEQWGRLHQTLVRVLRVGGHYIHRLDIIPENWEVQPVRKTLAYYGSLPFIPQRHFELFVHLLTDSFDQKTGIVSLGKIRKNLASCWRAGKFLTGQEIKGAGILLNRMFKFWGDVEKQWYFNYPNQLRDEISPYFKIVEESTSSDYLCAETTPFWFCQVKK